LVSAAALEYASQLITFDELSYPCGNNDTCRGTLPATWATLGITYMTDSDQGELARLDKVNSAAVVGGPHKHLLRYNEIQRQRMHVERRHRRMVFFVSILWFKFANFSSLLVASRHLIMTT
jgi:hypothetical protein